MNHNRVPQTVHQAGPTDSPANTAYRTKPRRPGVRPLSVFHTTLEPSIRKRLSVSPNGELPGFSGFLVRKSYARAAAAPRKSRNEAERGPGSPRFTGYRETISVLLVNVDTLAQIHRYVVSILCRFKLTELGRADVKLSQVDPRFCQLGIGYCNIVRQHRIRHGRFSGLGD